MLRTLVRAVLLALIPLSTTPAAAVALIFLMALTGFTITPVVTALVGALFTGLTLLPLIALATTAKHGTAWAVTRGTPT